MFITYPVEQVKLGNIPTKNQDGSSIFNDGSVDFLICRLNYFGNEEKSIETFQNEEQALTCLQKIKNLLWVKVATQEEIDQDLQNLIDRL